MKKVLNFVTKRKSSNRDRSQDGSTAFEGSSLGRSSNISSAGSSGHRFSPDPKARGSISIASASASAPTKYNVDTRNGRDKSLNKLHVTVWNEDLEKTKKIVRSDHQVKKKLMKI